jgi:hypothetical protein
MPQHTLDFSQAFDGLHLLHGISLLLGNLLLVGLGVFGILLFEEFVNAGAAYFSPCVQGFIALAFGHQVLHLFISFTGLKFR